MNIIHRFSMNAPQRGEQAKILDFFQISYEFVPLTARDGILSFEVAEGTSTWEAIKQHTLAWQCFDLVRTEFTARELAASSYLVMRPQWIQGYPMPDDDSFLEETYGDSGCSKCGAGRRQIAPFRMRSEPKLNRRSIFQLNWVPDEIFIKKELFELCFLPLGMSSWEVLDHRKNSPYQSVVQVKIESVAKSRLEMAESINVCSNCGRIRHSNHVKGFFPSYSTVPTKDPIFRTNELFGEGGVSWREIIVTQDIYQLLLTHEVYPISFYPLRNG